MDIPPQVSRTGNQGDRPEAQGCCAGNRGRATGDDEMRARGEGNQIGGHVRSRLGEAGRKVSAAIERERDRKRRR